MISFLNFFIYMKLLLNVNICFLGDKRMDKFSPATCELFGHLVFKGNIEIILKFCTFLVNNLYKLLKYN